MWTNDIFRNIYLGVQGVVIFFVVLLALLMLIRVVLNYMDPNPFGVMGRFAYRFKKSTDSLVWPAAKILARLNVTTKIAPLVSILFACVIGYFVLSLSDGVLATVKGVMEGVADVSVTRIIGHALSGVLTIYSLLIVIRIVFSWISPHGNRFTRFLGRFTDPILVPFRRIIPPLGVFDISPIVVLLLLNFLQVAVRVVFLK